MGYSFRLLVAQRNLSVRIVTALSDTAVQCEREKYNICIHVAAHSISVFSGRPSAALSFVSKHTRCGCES
jgi:hypothetical protein